MTNLDPISQKIAGYRTKVARKGSYSELHTGHTYLYVTAETDETLHIARALKKGKLYSVEVYADPVPAAKKETAKPKIALTVRARSIALLVNRARLSYASHQAAKDAKKETAVAPVNADPTPPAAEATATPKPAAKPRARKPKVAAE